MRLRIAERRLARRYWHQAPWRNCNETTRGFCVRCAWRKVTGKQARARAEYVERIRAMR